MILRWLGLFHCKKKKNKTTVEHYRPISVLSIIYKVFGKIVFKQLNNFFNGT